MNFLRIVHDKNVNKWIISSALQLKPGFEFLIVCGSQNAATDIVLKINNREFNIPTIDPNGFTNISDQFPLFQNSIQVFEPKK